MITALQRRIGSVRPPSEGRRSFWLRDDERGGPLIELAIVAPLFLYLAISVFDLGSILITHMILTQAAREGVHEAGATPFLEPGTWQYDGNACYIGARDMNDPSTWVPCIGKPKQMKIMKIVHDTLGQYSDFLMLKPYGIQVQSEFDVVGDTVAVQVSVVYSGNMIPFDGLWLRVRRTGAYL
jgi:hypothetical protein